MRDKTKNHIVNQKQAKNKTRNTHKKKLTAKEKLKININKQEPETKKNHMPDCKAVTSESRPHFMPRGILPSWQPEVRLVSRTQLETSVFSLRLVQSLSLCRNGSKLPCDGIWQELQAEQVLQFPSTGFGLSPQFGQGHIQTLRCIKTDKIVNNCPSCRTHMAIVILQEKNLMKSTLP